MGISLTDLCSYFPFLYHMAEPGSWESIKRHGLLSTSALLDLFEIDGSERERIEECHRTDCIPITHPIHGNAVVRDQLPMSDAGLAIALRDNLSPKDWYRMLNQRVFFWVNEKRLQRLLNARAYRNRRQTVLVIESKNLVRCYADRVRLSPYNSGATKPNPFPRGVNTFLPPSQYDFDYWRRKRSRKEAIVELTVEHSIPDVASYVLLAKEVGADQPERLLWKR